MILLLAAAAALAQAAPLTVAEARASMVGRWEGKLEYRDYQADAWFGLPMKVDIRDAGDGVTQIRTADFDDGPRTGIVRITGVAMLAKDGVTETGASFRKGKDVSLDTARLALKPGPASATNWTLVAEQTATDDNRPARLRETTTRTGDTMVTLKEVDFIDDQGEAWLVRNRTTLKRM
ncbi:hypothetical protein GCM10022281_09300 [Sphingomonas rosea]|uniref:FABP family protein n=1 Tax=Sphingomonas rosea TaxID=335605 RepID=A0ABP7TVW1_9SPHN